jgi:UDPglucose 6-dehydrogenase
VLISSQLPVDTCRRLEDEFVSRGHRFACSPENLRLGKAIEIFSHPDRVIVGCRDARDQKLLADVFRPFTDNIIWMRPESAEMTKHALNSFLALSITFMNEVARLCEVTGADAKEVERGLKSESRIGPKAYLSPGGAFAGGTLARDVVALASLGDRHQKALELLPAIKRSNDQHRQWALQKVRQTLPNPAQATVTLLGLTYKPGTNTLRRSSAVELARALHAAGFKVRACDPSRPVLPAELSFIEIFPTPAEAVPGAQAAVVCTEWPEFRQVDWSALLMQSRLPLLVDASRFLEKNVAGLPGLQYIAVGSPA